MTRRASLFSYEFCVLALAATFGFCNIAVFYGFASWLDRLGIPPAWHGALLGAEPLAAVCLRPLLVLRLTPSNALAVARTALTALGLALCGYLLAHDVPTLLAVRVLHGAAFVCLVSAVTMLVAQVIPSGASGRAFSVFTLTSQVPYAVVPPVAEALLRLTGREDRVYALFALLVVPALALLQPLRQGRGRTVTAASGSTPVAAPRLADVGQLLGHGPVALVLAANGLLFLSTTLVFFYMKEFALAKGLSDPGWFFTVSTLASIAMRLGAASFTDRLPKAVLLAVALACLAVCMASFTVIGGVTGFLLLAAGYGCSLGMALPMLNAVMFDQTPPARRGMALNLLLWTMDMGYVLGPLLGGAILTASSPGEGQPADYGTLFLACAACAALATLFAGRLAWTRRQRPA